MKRSPMCELVFENGGVLNIIISYFYVIFLYKILYIYVYFVYILYTNNIS